MPTRSFRRNNLMLDVTDLATQETTFDLVTTIDNKTNTDTVDVDPTVIYSPNGAFEITGSATSARNVGEVTLTGTAGDPTGTLATGYLGFDNSYKIYDPIDERLQSGLIVTETDLEGQQASAPVGFTSQGGIVGQRYVAVQTNMDPQTQNVTGQVFFRADGAIVYHSTNAVDDDGPVSIIYCDGAYFDAHPFYAFTETHDADGELLKEQRHRNDGRNVSIAEAPGQTLTSSVCDLFRGNGQDATQFAFSSGYVEDLILGFRLSGPGHDTLSLPASDFSNIPDVLRATQNTSQGVVITDPVSGDTINISNVSKADLIDHKDVFSLH